MAINIPSFPDVPIAAGVPAVLRNPVAPSGSYVNSASNISLGTSQSNITGIISNIQRAIPNGYGSSTGLINGAFGNPPIPLTSDSPSISSSSNPSQWGIYDQSGNKVITPSTFGALEYGEEWRIADYPIEQGGFQSYNKVKTPFTARVKLMKHGVPDVLTQFLSSVDIIANDTTNLYNITTPIWTYSDVSIQKYDYKRTATTGVTMLTVEIVFQEIRITQQTAFSNTATPSGANQVNVGTVQPQPVSATSQTQILASLSGTGGGV